MIVRKAITTVLVLVCASTLSAQDLPQPGDVVFGLGEPDAATTIELIRGPAGMNTGMQLTSPWVETPFIQGVQFDNFNGVAHNARGNLLGVNFGATATGGGIWNFATTSVVAAGQQLSGDGAPSGITTGRLGGLSVNPSNNKIAVNDYDAGQILVFDYTAGDTMGGGASLGDMISTTGDSFGSTFLSVRDTQGTAWLDDETVVALNSDGNLSTFNTTTLAEAQEQFILTPFVGSDTTAIEYNPDVSPYIFAAYSGFSGGTENRLYVIDPADFSLQHTVDLSTSVNTLRDLAFDADGNLFMAQYGGSDAPGPFIDILLGAADSPLTIADNSSVDYYQSAVESNFNSIDIGLGTDRPNGDFDGNGLYECNDVDSLVDEIVQVAGGAMPNLDFDMTQDGTVDTDDLDEWRAVAGPALGYAGDILEGDSNLDGTVDGNDFLTWNTNKFTDDNLWCGGDFNADGTTDGGDFLIWNTNKFQSSDVSSVPEPAMGLLSLLGGLAFLLRRRS